MRGTECARKNTSKGEGARLLWARVSTLGQHSHVNQQEWIQFDQHTRHGTSSSNVARCVGRGWLCAHVLPQPEKATIMTQADFPGFTLGSGRNPIWVASQHTGLCVMYSIVTVVQKVPKRNFKCRLSSLHRSALKSTGRTTSYSSTSEYT